jgi:hypothetical protein
VVWEVVVEGSELGLEHAEPSLYAVPLPEGSSKTVKEVHKRGCQVFSDGKVLDIISDLIE